MVTVCTTKPIPVQTWTGPEGSRRLKLPDFKTVGTCEPYTAAAFSPRKYSWYPFLLEAEPMKSIMTPSGIEPAT